MSIPVIGSVLTPANFQVMSQENQVQVTWSFSPLATIYYVSRSSDGITYAELGTTTLLEYADTTGVVGTVYWYYVQAGQTITSIPYSSNPTVAQKALSLNPGITTVGN